MGSNEWEREWFPPVLGCNKLCRTCESMAVGVRACSAPSRFTTYYDDGYIVRQSDYWNEWKCANGHVWETGRYNASRDYHVG